MKAFMSVDQVFYYCDMYCRVAIRQGGRKQWTDSRGGLYLGGKILLFFYLSSWLNLINQRDFICLFGYDILQQICIMCPEKFFTRNELKFIM